VKVSSCLFAFWLLLGFCENTYCQTNVGGEITGNTTWTKANSPYIVISNIRIQPTGSLTIEPGVAVRFNSGIQLTANGRLIAVGTEADSIVFSSVSGDWGGLRFETGGSTTFDGALAYLSGSILKYVSIRNYNSMEIAGAVTIKQNVNLYVAHSAFVDNDSFGAIAVLDGGDVVVEHALFKNNSAGIRTPPGNHLRSLLLKNCNFQSHSYGVIAYLVGSSKKLAVTDCHFSNNQNINLLSSVNTASIPYGSLTIDIKYNTFDNSPVEAIQIPFLGTGNIEANVIKTAIGIVTANNNLVDPGMSLNIHKNRFLNTDRAISIAEYRDVNPINTTISDNYFETSSNGHFIEIYKGSGYELSGNTFIQTGNGSGFMVRNETSTDVNAEGNYWGTTDQTVIATKIFDFYDDGSKGKIITSNPLSAPGEGIFLAPEAFFKGQKNGQTFLTWLPNSQPNVAGYKLFKKIGQIYHLVGDIGNVTSYSSSEINDSDDLYLTAYSTNADGDQDYSEGNESTYSASAAYFLSLVQSPSANCSGVSMVSQITSTYPLASNYFILQMSDKNGSFAKTINLDSITSAAKHFSATLPDTLQYGVAYKLRVLVSGVDATHDIGAVTPYQTPPSDFSIPGETCGTDPVPVDYTGLASADLTYQWTSSGGVLIEDHGSNATLYWSSTGTKSVTLQATANGCSSTTTKTIVVKRRPTSEFSAPASLCEGQHAALVYKGDASPGATYRWDFGDFQDSSQVRDYNVSWATLGIKPVSLSVAENGCLSEPTHKIVNYVKYPELNIKWNAAICYGTQATIDMTGSTYEQVVWDWDGGNTPELVDNIYHVSWGDSGDKTIIATANNSSCVTEKAFVVRVGPSPHTPSLCFVTVDSVSKKNKLVWGTPQGAIEKFGIYRETNVSGDYALVKFVDAKSGNFIDGQSSPGQKANRYKLVAVDTCGNISLSSPVYKTMHLTINKGQGDGWNLIWDGYEGFSFGTYNIMRSVNGSPFELITQVASNLNSFTDLNVPHPQVAYRVEVAMADLCSEDNNNTQARASRSNEAGSLITGIETEDSSVTLYPNPTSLVLNLQTLANTAGSYIVYNALGQQMLNGKFLGPHVLDVSELRSGLYIFLLTTAKGSRKQIILVK
jgi:hypothetical protein